MTVTPTLCRAVEHDAARLIALSHDLHAHPEVAWEEVWSSARVAGELADAGFTVESRYLGLDTAFRASAGSGPLHVALCAEYDALPGLGHACGHNVIAAISSGAGMALARLADDLGLTVHVLGTPAEEGGGGKIELLDRGAFAGMHVAALVHPGPVDVAKAEPYAVSHSRIAYRGTAAHAAAYPERGVNAADAFTVAQVAIGLLRQQLPAGTRVHGVVTRAGDAPNAIPAYAEGRWYVRASDLSELAAVEERVRRCFDAGAVATGCELSVEPESKPYASFRNDAELTELYETAARELGRTFGTGPDSRMNRASTDLGNVSQVIPAIHPYIGIDSLPAVNHQAEFAAAAITPAADTAVVQGAQALALTLARAATDEAVRQRLLGGGQA
ncbi:M20 family metallopeptidase [Prauserella oleivorans]|uniref:Peptidase M20 domain-containing protein 2 n=1 Tax=Prauserella oleivorans TaxID=1478153 RepID=A0ABW5W913_9PSEU